MYGKSEYGSGIPNSYSSINHDYNHLENNNYIARSPTFSGDSSEFEW